MAAAFLLRHRGFSPWKEEIGSRFVTPCPVNPVPARFRASPGQKPIGSLGNGPALDEDFIRNRFGRRIALRSTIAVQIRREYQDQFAATTDYWQRAAIEQKIRREVRKRLKRLISPYSLYSAARSWFQRF